MIPKSGYRFPACAKPLVWFVVWLDASAGEGRSDKIMLHDSEVASRGLAPVALSATLLWTGTE
jgi:hypothetical protein